MLRFTAGALTHEGFAASAAVRSCGLRRQVSRRRGGDAPGAANLRSNLRWRWRADLCSATLIHLSRTRTETSRAAAPRGARTRSVTSSRVWLHRKRSCRPPLRVSEDAFEAAFEDATPPTGGGASSRRSPAARAGAAVSATLKLRPRG